MITVGSLFAGIGGIDLGLERTGGFKTVWQVEINDYATKVLEKHWPDVRRWRDVRTFPPEPVDEWRCDLICGGFPCQDISSAGYRGGIDGRKSGLWAEYIRVVCLLRPRWVFVENVADLTIRGLDRVLGDLATSGYDAEWQMLPAAFVGLPHVRNRTWIIAYPNCDGIQQKCYTEKSRVFPVSLRDYSGGLGEAQDRARQASTIICGMDDGISGWVDRLRCLGNAVVPQVAQWIGHRILEQDQ